MKRPALGHLLGYTALTVMLTAGAAQSLAGTNTVFSDDIVDGTIKHVDIQPNTIGTSRLRDNSITTGKILDGTLLAQDFAAGASGYSFLSVSSASDSNSPKEISVDCPAGTYVVGSYHDIAGGKAGSAPNQTSSVVVDKLLPTGANGILTNKPTRVYLQAYESQAITGNWSLRVGVTCAKMS